MLICGIDEAGRGPLLGPLVICGIVMDEKDLNGLEFLGIKDSKQLTEKKREEIYKILITKVKYKVIKLSPDEIDSAVFSDESNLNILEAKTTAKIINELKPDRTYIDLPEKFPHKYNEKITSDLFDKGSVLISEHKADENYLIVSAASIIAKVERDEEIKKLAKKFKNIGSGYPSDPITQKFLEENYSNKRASKIFRKSWQSYKNVILKNTQKKILEF